MALFQYRGLDKAGRAVAGTMAAEDATNLEEKLRASGYWLLDARAKEGTQSSRNSGGKAGALSWGTGVKRRDLIEFCTMMGFQCRASIYPMIVLSVVCAFVLLLFSFVIPKFVTLLAAANVPLPLLTQIVFGASDFAKATWWVWPLLGLVLYVSVRTACRLSKGFRLWFDELKLNLPVFGELQLMLAISRFAHNLALLYKAGIAIVTALKLCEDLVGNAVVEKAVREMQAAIESGDSISEAMGRHRIFPSLLVRMVAIGETSGNLDVGLQNVSDYYHDVVPRRIKAIFALVEPAMIVFLVMLVGTIAIAIFLPILSLMSVIK